MNLLVKTDVSPVVLMCAAQSFLVAEAGLANHGAANKQAKIMTPAEPKLKIVGNSNSAGRQPPHIELGLTPAQLLAAYKQMLTCRRFEEKAASLYQQGQIAGFCHLYIGQEAVAVGAKVASEKGDDVITSYRCHAHALVCGVPAEQVMGELTGRAIGISKGKGGSMHMFDVEKRFWGGHGIVAAQVPLGAGLAFASKYKKEKRVSLTFVGDGAMNAGQTFEAMNMAALWQLPVVFVIENNQWGMGTSVPRAAAGDLYKRGEPFGIACAKADGMDFLESYKAFKKAINHCRSGKGPYVLELDTYRYRGHSMSDPAKYRTREDVEGVREHRDPIARLQKYLMETLNIPATDFDKMDDEIKGYITGVAELATTAPLADVSDLYTDVTP
jgi:pyruvate dehydrogenase E1 component alpha subunit